MKKAVFIVNFYTETQFNDAETTETGNRDNNWSVKPFIVLHTTWKTGQNLLLRYNSNQ